MEQDFGAGALITSGLLHPSP